MTPVELLRAARKRISDPSCWTCFHCARDQYGHPITPKNPSATSWCIVGALAAECDDRMSDECLTVERALLSETGILVGDYNDSRTHAEVIDMVDRVISKLETA